MITLITVTFGEKPTKLIFVMLLVYMPKGVSNHRHESMLATLELPIQPLQ